jgi:thymidylate kinase
VFQGFPVTTQQYQFFTGGDWRAISPVNQGFGGVAQVGRGPKARDALAPLITIIGCDGAGKSTLGAELTRRINGARPARLCYLGLGSGDMGRKIKSFRLGGPLIEGYLSKKAAATRTRGKKIPGIGTALVVYGFSLLRLIRFKRMMALRRRGVTVVTDRYPQIEVAGLYDGPGLSAARPGNRLVAFLARQERKMYERMAAVLPDVVIRLGIDAETAFARKPDHSIDQLRAKVAVTSALTFGGASIVDVDARRPFAEVLETVSAVARQVGVTGAA